MLLAACQAPEGLWASLDFWLWSGGSRESQRPAQRSFCPGHCHWPRLLGSPQTTCSAEAAHHQGCFSGPELRPDLTPGLRLWGSSLTGVSSPQGSEVLTTSFPTGTNVNEPGRHSTQAIRDAVTKTPRGDASSRPCIVLSFSVLAAVALCVHVCQKLDSALFKALHLFLLLLF